MPWLKLDDGFASHRKVAHLFEGPCPGDAIALFVLAGTWCARELTDGLVPVGFVVRSGLHKKAAAELVRVKLFDAGESGGYWLHNYLRYNPTREKVLAEREEGRIRAGKSHAKKQTKKARSFEASSPEDNPKPGRSPGVSSLAPVPVPVPVSSRSESSSPPACSDSSGGSARAAVIPFAERRATEPWLRVWQLFEELKGRVCGSAGANRDACETIARVAADRLSPAESFDAVVTRGLQAWLADPWVARNQPPLSNIAKNPGKYLDAPVELPPAAPAQSAGVLRIVAELEALHERRRTLRAANANGEHEGDLMTVDNEIAGVELRLDRARAKE